MFCRCFWNSEDSDRETFHLKLKFVHFQIWDFKLPNFFQFFNIVKRRTPILNAGVGDIYNWGGTFSFFPVPLFQQDRFPPNKKYRVPTLKTRWMIKWIIADKVVSRISRSAYVYRVIAVSSYELRHLPEERRRTVPLSRFPYRTLWLPHSIDISARTINFQWNIASCRKKEWSFGALGHFRRRWIFNENPFPVITFIYEPSLLRSVGTRRSNSSIFQRETNIYNSFNFTWIKDFFHHLYKRKKSRISFWMNWII